MVASHSGEQPLESTVPGNEGHVSGIHGGQNYSGGPVIVNGIRGEENGSDVLVNTCVSGFPDKHNKSESLVDPMMHDTGIRNELSDSVGQDNLYANGIPDEQNSSKTAYSNAFP